MNKNTSQLLLGLVWLIWGCGSEVEMVQVDPPNLTITRAATGQNLKAKALDSQNNEVAGVTLSYKSENPSVATVDADGIVRPAGNGSTAIVVQTPSGITGEAFVKVCLPKEIICDPPDRLMLKVGSSGPIKCKAVDCADNKVPATPVLTPTDSKKLLKEGDDVFIGLAIGETAVTVKAAGLEKTIVVRVDDQNYLPGAGPGSGGGGGGGGGKGGGGGDSGGDPYKEGGGRFGHILKNMNF